MCSLCVSCFAFVRVCLFLRTVGSGGLIQILCLYGAFFRFLWMSSAATTFNKRKIEYIFRTRKKKHGRNWDILQPDSFTNSDAIRKSLLTFIFLVDLEYNAMQKSLARIQFEGPTDYSTGKSYELSWKNLI